MTSRFTRRRFLAGASAAALHLALPGWPSSAAVANPAQSSAVRELYRGAIVIDTLVIDSPELDASVAIEAGMTAAVMDLQMYPRNLTSAVKIMGAWNEVFSRPGSRLIKVTRAAGLETAKAENKFGIILACQDAAILGVPTLSVNDYNLGNLRMFYGLGLRVLQLTHNDGNAVADSYREKNDAGLTRLGEAVIENMNSLGMLIDLSHCSDQTTSQAIALSPKPCAVTHAGCRALYPTRRNKTDEQIRALAGKGGVFGVFNMSNWLTDAPANSLENVLDHLDHAVNVGGIDHVSFGADHGLKPVDVEQNLESMQAYAKKNLGLPGAERIPSHVIIEELNTPARLLHLADGLSRRGYNSAAIEKIIGGNFLRLFREVCG